jgi:alcohol dehydrogenase class IV
MAQTISFPSSVPLILGPGSVTRVGNVAREIKLDKVLLVTDAGLVEAGISQRVASVLASAGIECVVFDAVEPNPSIETVEQAALRYREASCTGLVAVGGGSPMDVAKAAGVLVTNPSQISAYLGRDRVRVPLPPLVAIPTTVGTGSEVTTVAVISDQTQRKKVVIGSPFLAPRVALLDPELVLSLPAQLVASTGLDALTHAIESIISVFAIPFTDALALEAIRLIVKSLSAGVEAAELDSRAHLLYASTMAGMAFRSARTGLVHAMSHPLSCYYDVPHGLANAILLPYVLAFNAAVCEDQLARVAQAVGETASAWAAIEAVQRLSADVGIPSGLSEVGVTDVYIPAMAQDAFESENAQIVNPRKPTLSEVADLYRQAL